MFLKLSLLYVLYIILKEFTRTEREAFHVRKHWLYLKDFSEAHYIVPDLESLVSYFVVLNFL